jgi:hypothetical protein
MSDDQGTQEMFAYQLATRRLKVAEANCPHWDYESDGPGKHDCCVELSEALQECKTMREALREVQS